MSSTRPRRRRPVLGLPQDRRRPAGQAARMTDNLPHRTTRICAVAAALALFASVVLSLALSPGTAHANCSGTTASNGTLSIFGVVYATETPVTGTCNGNSYYQTDMQSSYLTWRTSFHVQNNGIW